MYKYVYVCICIIHTHSIKEGRLGGWQRALSGVAMAPSQWPWEEGSMQLCTRARSAASRLDPALMSEQEAAPGVWSLQTQDVLSDLPFCLFLKIHAKGQQFGF